MYVYVWVHLLLSLKPLKVQSCSSPPHHPHHHHEKWSYSIILSKNFTPYIFSAFIEKTVFLTSGSGGEVDSSYHLLDLFFILQDVGPYSANLVLVVLDQLIQFIQFCLERLHCSVCRSAANK